MQTIQILKQLCQSFGVAGQEQEAVACAGQLCQQLGELSSTPHGSLICRIHPPREGGVHLMLNAHIDEIGLLVTHIEDSGFLRVDRCGGVDRRLLAASPVVVHTPQGELPGVIAVPAEHLEEGTPKNLTLRQVCVDVGLTGEEARARIPLGSRISFAGPFTQLQNGLVSGKALDDRCGCAAIVLAGEQLRRQGADFGLSLMFSTQEETSALGSATAAWALRPTHSIVVDVTFADAPGLGEFHCGKLGSGPMVGMSALLSREMAKGLLQTAQQQEIPCQVEVMGGGHTGTDADSIAPSREGVCTCCLSIPQRNMHTPVEIVSAADVENTAKLIAEYAIREFQGR